MSNLVTKFLFWSFRSSVWVENKIKIAHYVFLRYHGQVGANLLLGGVDCTGGHLYDIGPYGDMDKVPFLAMGESLLTIYMNMIGGF